MDWIVIGNLDIPFGFVVDQVSVTMMVVVTIVFNNGAYSFNWIYGS